MKKLITIILILGMIGLVIAGTISLRPTDVLPDKTKTTTEKGLITFDCGKKHMNVTIHEMDGYIDEGDIQRATKGMCDIPITNIVNWRSETFKENPETKEKSFDEERLTIDSLNK